MNRGKNIALAVILFIAYAVGLPLFLIGVLGSEQILFTIIGLVLCGLPTAIIVCFFGSTFIGSGRRGGSLLSYIAMFLIGLFLGLAVTPIIIIVLIVAAVRAKAKAQQAAQPVEEPVAQPVADPFAETAAQPVETAPVSDTQNPEGV